MLSRLQYQEIKEIFPKAKPCELSDKLSTFINLNNHLVIQVSHENKYFCLFTNKDANPIKESDDANQIILYLKALNFAATNIN